MSTALAVVPVCGGPGGDAKVKTPVPFLGTFFLL